MKRTLFALAAVLGFIGALMSPIGTQAQSTVKNYFQGCSGVNCDNILNLGGTWKVGGTAVTATAAQLNGSVAAGVAGVAAGYKIARGTVTLDGSNPSSATTGLAAIVACVVVDKRSTSPALDPTNFTTVTAAVAGRLDVYAWKPTSAVDGTLIASTDADDTIDWMCVGT